MDDLTSRDILSGNVEKIAELFPGVVTEAQDEATGQLRKVIDFDLLRQHLSDELVEGDRERFRLDWPGKKASILKANTPTTKTLRPVREDSEDFDTTQNVFIEGDNFEVLKVLQESYLGKIKMIYIDPPYNTGKDFIYKDNFAADREDYEEEIGVRDDENGGKLVKNTETNGRYHSDWLSMMQERLIVARDLLTDDGVIFISIDDNEQANLKSLCDEAFGGNNFIGNITWRRSNSQANIGTFSTVKDAILIYARDIDLLSFGRLPLSDKAKKEYQYTDDHGKYARTPIVHLARGRHRFSVKLHNGSTIDGPWMIKEQEFKDLQAKNLLHWPENGGNPMRKVYLHDQLEKGQIANDFWDSSYGNNKLATEEVKQLFNGVSYFDFPKPVLLVKNLINLGSTSRNDTILDFFSGSATTAHAVMQLNAEDSGNRKHIQVQLAEPTDETSEAYKAGYKSIPEISRERISRAGKQIREDYAKQIAKRDTPLDTGFRAYKLSSSNFVNTAQHPSDTTQASLLDVTDNIVEGRSAEDLLTEVILGLGLTLDLPIEQRDITGHNVFFVGGNSLVACFDDSVSLDIVDNIAAEKPLRVVFKDSSFTNDETRINIDIRLKQLSPDTTVQVV